MAATTDGDKRNGNRGAIPLSMEGKEGDSYMLLGLEKSDIYSKKGVAVPLHLL